MYLLDLPLNYFAIFCAALVYFILGCIWYHPRLLGQQWHKNEEKINEQEASVPVAYAGEFVIDLIMAYMMAVFIEMTQVDDIGEGLKVALWIWIGFIATTHFSAVLWGRKTLRNFFVHSIFMLVGVMLMSLIIMFLS